MQLQKAWLRKEFVLMSGHRSILHSEVFKDIGERDLTLLVKDESEAEQIAAVLAGDVSDAKQDGKREPH
jgi:hypothetical protein